MGISVHISIPFLQGQTDGETWRWVVLAAVPSVLPCNFVFLILGKGLSDKQPSSGHLQLPTKYEIVSNGYMSVIVQPWAIICIRVGILHWPTNTKPVISTIIHRTQPEHYINMKDIVLTIKQYLKLHHSNRQSFNDAILLLWNSDFE